MQETYGVFIGRFQPFHNSHLKAVEYALTQCDHLIIVIGSCYMAATTKDPWDGLTRERMIRGSLSRELSDRVTCVQARDYLYNDNLWLTSVQGLVHEAIATRGSKHKASNVRLFGFSKDETSFYLKLFPQWETIELPKFGDLSATQIRDIYFGEGFTDELSTLVPAGTQLVLKGITEKYRDLATEKKALDAYKARWAVAPYPVTFVTVDACVICSGHVLLVRRKGFPGRGLYALPGGFLNQDEDIFDASIRELKEETGIKISAADLAKAKVDEKVFGHPKRSLRGRTITHAFCFNLNVKQNKLPAVKGRDDADKAFWMQLSEALASEDKFFEDHLHIIRAFVNKF